MNADPHDPSSPFFSSHRNVRRHRARRKRAAASAASASRPEKVTAPLPDPRFQGNLAQHVSKLTHRINCVIVAERVS
jgi:hypothetical protein